jgi:DNA-directed RNA polymerase subunit L
MGLVLCVWRKGVISVARMVQENVGNMQDYDIKVTCRVAHIIHTKGTWQRITTFVDYRGLIKGMIVNRSQLLVMRKLQDCVRAPRIFTKIDLQNGYHLIRVKEGDQWKMGFNCGYSLYEFMVIPFRLTYTLNTFQDMMNHILMDLLDKGVIVYITDVLIYPKSSEKHDILVEEVVNRLGENKLGISLEKYTWSSKQVDFVGYMIPPERMEMVEDKIKAKKDWQPPKSWRALQSFLGFASFYYILVKGVLNRLGENKLGISLEKYTWSSKQVDFVGYMITPERMEMVKDKIKAKKDWQPPKSGRALQSFLGFASFD